MMSGHSEDELLAFTRAMANMVAADGRVTEEERQELDNVISGIGLSPRDPQVVGIVNAEFEKPGDLTQIVSAIGSKDLRAALVRLLVEMACTDGEIADDERRKVNEAANVFGFTPDLVEELVGWTVESLRLEARERDLMARMLA